MADKWEQFIEKQDKWSQFEESIIPSQTTPPIQPTKGVGGIPLGFAGGFNVGLANVLGMPVDIVNKIQGLMLPTSPTPIGGSEWIRKNIMPTPMKPEGFLETTAGAIGEQIPYGLSSMIFPGSRLMDVGKYAVGAGTASGLARTAYPESPYVDLAAQLVGGAGIPAIKTGYQALTRPKPADIEKGIAKGIRPSVVGKGTAAEAQRYSDQAKVAVNTILENKNNLRFTDETGQVIIAQGELPKNLKQFGEAIEQTRQSIYKEYNAMTKQAGQAPQKIDLSRVANELDIIANDPAVLREAPRAARYAKQRADAYRNNVYSPEEAEQAIAINNRKLRVLPTQADANNAWVDKLVNDKLRLELDNLIENAVGTGYKELKNKYGALKTIEKDVTHRAWIDARKPEAGFFDVTNVFTGFEAIRGILSGNIGMIVAAAGSKGIANWMKWINNPNRTVKNLFINAEKMTLPTTISPLERVTMPSAINIYARGNRMEQ